MKVLKIIPIYLLVIILFISCDKEDPQPQSLPFILNFFSIGGPVDGDASCGSPPIVLIKQEGAGSGTVLGDFDFFSQFCNNLATGEYFGGPSAEGYFTDSNGDRIFIQASGQVIPSTHPDYDLEFKDPFTIVGGTGRYEGATGSGMTDSFVKLATGQTDHIWTGTINIVK